MSDTSKEIIKQEKNPIIERIENDAMMSFIEGLLPQIKPFIDPAMTKLEEYFGDDEKIFLIRRKAGKTPLVIELSNKVGNYNISYDSETGEKIFKASEDSVLNIHNSGEFVEKLLKGEFSIK